MIVESSARQRRTYPVIAASIAMFLAFACTAEITSSDPTLENPDVDSSGLVIGLEPAGYDTARLAQGHRYYVDRTHTLTELPAPYRGWVWVRTANDDKSAVADSLVSFELSERAIVSVAYDKRGTSLPQWLSDWAEAPEGVGVSDDGASPLRIFHKAYPAGPVVLGGNLASGANGAQSNYVLLLLKASQLEPTRVRISPAAVNLDPGATQQFSAQVEDQVGNAVAGSFEWSATGGSISAAGLYTAGDVPGSHRVIALETARGLADTAEVSIAGPSGALQVSTTTTGSDLDPNGYTVIIDGAGNQPIGINDQITIPELPAGDHSVALGGVASNCTVSGANPRTVTIVAGSTASTDFIVTCTDAGADRVINDITFDWSTYRNLASGSDNWPLTWCEDDHQYTSWGDGGGFGGTNTDGRVSLGFARIEGDYPNFTGINVWGGKNAENPSLFDGKSRSMLCINGILYAWRSPGSNIQAFSWKQIIRSTDKGAHWQENAFPDSKVVGDCVGCPGLPFFINYGQNYTANGDGYVYTYWIRVSDPTAWHVQKPGVMWLARAPVSGEAFGDTANWEWLTGDAPTWGAWSDRVPVLEDADGLMRSSALYVPGLDRYVMVTNHTEKGLGNVAFWEAPRPWGPWRLISKKFGWPSGETNVVNPEFVFGVFSPKWLSADGRNCVFVWFGPDRWNSVACRFETAP